MKLFLFLPALALGRERPLFWDVEVHGPIPTPNPDSVVNIAEVVANLEPYEPSKEPANAIIFIEKCKTLSDFSASEYRDCLNYFKKSRCRWVGRFGVFKILTAVHR